VLFALESLYLLGNVIHGALLDLVQKMTDFPEEMGAMAWVESDKSVKVKELLERAKPKWEEMIRVLKAQLPGAQELQSCESCSVMSPATHQASPRPPGALNAIEVAPTVPQFAPPATSDAPAPPQSPIIAGQQFVVATAGDGVAPAAPTTPTSLLSPTAPSTDAVERQTHDLPLVPGLGSPLTASPASPIGEESTGRKRKASEEVDVAIARKKPASNRKKGPPSEPQRKQPLRGRSKAPDSDPVTQGESSKPDTIMEEDIE